jgi:hypothetical protein
MIRIGSALASLAIAALAVLQAFDAPAALSAAPDAGALARVAPGAPGAPGAPALADTTIAATAAAGSVLVRMLPDSLSGEPVSSYRTIVIPARGWLYGRSFFWRVPSDARGAYTFLFAAAREAAPDTVRLRVTVAASE